MDFNDLFILECYENLEDRVFLGMFEIPSLKDFNLSSRHQFLLKNQYIVEDPNNSDKIILSLKGKDLLDRVRVPDSLMSASVMIIDFSKTPDECFEEWWKAFPTSPAWTSDDGSTSFIGSRVLKNLRKPKAKEKYLTLLNQGLKHEDLMGALGYEINQKKLDSIKKNENQMEYFKGMESYLNQGRYLLYIDLFKNNPALGNVFVKAKKKNVTDI